MNYFELYEMPIALQVDPNMVKKKFYSLSRQFHPDFFTNASENEQEKALEQSSLINQAYITFQNTDSLLQYVLQIKGLLVENEKYELPPDFLMEMMELNEAIMDMEMDGINTEKLQQVKDTVIILQQKIYADVAKIVAHYQEGITTQKELLQVKDYYFKKKYLLRILDKINELCNIAAQS